MKMGALLTPGACRVTYCPTAPPQPIVKIPHVPVVQPRLGIGCEAMPAGIASIPPHFEAPAAVVCQPGDPEIQNSKGNMRSVHSVNNLMYMMACGGPWTRIDSQLSVLALVANWEAMLPSMAFDGGSRGASADALSIVSRPFSPRGGAGDGVAGGMFGG